MMRNTETLIYGLICHNKKKGISTDVGDICSHIKVPPKEVYRNLKKLLHDRKVRKEIKHYIRENYYK